MITNRDPEFIETVLHYYKVELGVPRPGRPLSAVEIEGWVQNCRNGMTGDQIQQAMHASAEGQAWALRPVQVIPKTPHLEQRGNDFVDEHGTRTSFCGVDGFTDYRNWLDDHEAKLLPLMQESNEVGFTVRRVFLSGDAAENRTFTLYPQHEPTFYSELVPFVQFQNYYGIIPLLTVNVDMQRVMPNRADCLRNWQHINAELRGHGLSYLMSLGNQHSKNGFDPSDADDPGPGVIWSRGSDVDDTKTAPNGAPASELHSTRISIDRSLMDAVASPINMRQTTNATMVWMTEGIPADNGSNPTDYYNFGRLYATCWALWVFHNRQSQRGQLMGPGTRACAEAAVRGSRL